MDDEIRYLSHQQYETLTNSIREQRLASLPHNPHKEKMPSAARIAEKILDAEWYISEEGLELGRKAWDLRKKGWSVERIRQKLRIPLEAVQGALAEFERRIGLSMARAMEHYRTLDDERIEELLERWLPVANNGSITIERIRQGVPVVETDYDRSMRATYLVLGAIDRRWKIMQTCQSDGEAGQGNQMNVLVWLQQVLPAVTRLYDEPQPNGTPERTKLVLESNVELPE